MGFGDGSIAGWKGNILCRGGGIVPVSLLAGLWIPLCVFDDGALHSYGL